MSRQDVILIGVGLANALIGYRLKQIQPHLNITLIDQAEAPSIRHTWSFHSTDVAGSPWVEDLIDHSWPGYEVRFPAYSRRFSQPYHSIRARPFYARIKKIFGRSMIFGRQVTSVDNGVVCFADHPSMEADLIIDGRGQGNTPKYKCGYQKFLGLDLQLNQPHNLTTPLLMDARVEQTDGYRFMYLLPWSENQVLVEDTRYSSRPDIAVDEYREQIMEYVKEVGWEVAAVRREERGVLPIPLVFPAPPSQLAPDIPIVGTRCGLFHFVTGYSLPDAVRVANLVSQTKDLSSFEVTQALHHYQRSKKPKDWYYLQLTRMMFGASLPDQRYKIFEHFYRQPDSVIERFYAGTSRWSDQLRILMGRPPVPVKEALRSLRGHGEIRQ